MCTYRFLILILIALMVSLPGCNRAELDRLSEQVSQMGRQNQELRRELEQAREPAQKLQELAGFMEGVKARMVTNKGTIEMEFYPETAPIHVFNFLSRAESGYYDGTQFHRIIPGFMIQGGDPTSKDPNARNLGQGGPIFSIPHEFNDKTHDRGVLSMARVSDKSVGAGSQFFIMHADTPRLDNEYTVFGRVTSGMDVVDEIAATETGSNNRPTSPMMIRSIELFR